jgi:Tol biopolymer transport system component
MTGRMALVVAAIVHLSGCVDSEPQGLEAVDPQPEPQPQVGSLVVANLTTGGAFDLDGYTLMVDGRVVEMDANEEATFAQQPVGPHTIELRGLSSNCAAGGASARTVPVQPGGAARVTFEVSCSAPPELAPIRIVFFTGGGIQGMNADGTGRRTLVAGRYTGPDPSPDGTQIVFSRVTAGSNALMIMNADGTDSRVLVAGEFYAADWAPDGRSIAAIAGIQRHGGPIKVITVTGGSARFLTGPALPADDWYPRWSPDGTRVAFSRYFGDGDDIWVVNADGTALRQLSALGGFAPVWSPDGRIGYRPYNPPGGTVVTVNSDGSEPRTLLESSTTSLLPSDWSRDGSLLLNGYRSSGSTLRADLYLLRLQDQALWRVTADAVDEYDPKFLETGKR